MTQHSNEKTIKQILDALSRRPTAFGPSPHKDILLLALLDVFEAGPKRENKFPLNDFLDLAFEKEWNRFVPMSPYTKTAIELPFWYLQNDGLWLLKAKPGMESVVDSFPRATRKRIAECIEYGYFSSPFFAFVSDDESRSLIRTCLEQRFRGNSHQRKDEPTMSDSNPFVSFLNTMQGTDANNQGALAESQARNPLFEEIRVDHELTPAILDTLLGTGRAPCNVILTGHAGDGKSTLALEVVRAIDRAASFERRTEVRRDGIRIVVIKDLSEWSEPERDNLLDEWLRADLSVRYLIVSNTGALLSLFCDRSEKAGKDRVSVESELLEACDSAKESPFAFGAARFAVHNLARRNNVRLGMDVLERMVESGKWEECRTCGHSGDCPIFANREILRRNKDLAFRRIYWLYERANAYGGRLTMRQMGAHFAFFLTGGRSCADVASMSAGDSGRLRFFNLFWGDDGAEDSLGAAHQLRAVALIRGQGFNVVRSPHEDRMLRDFGDNPLARTDPALAPVEERLRAPAPSRPGEEKEDHKAREARARRNYRRAVYFLGTPCDDPESKRAFDRFIDGFLRSPMLRHALAWRNDPATFNGSRLSKSLFRVLQEEFSGIQSPEGGAGGDKLYITLGGRTPGARRSVQPILADCDFPRNFSIVLDEDGTPEIRGRGRDLNNVKLPLPIPFLDYVEDRRNGELGRGLERAYRNRIEAFKAVILAKIPLSDDDGLLLLRRGADGSLKELSVRIRNDREGKKLEVF